MGASKGASAPTMRTAPDKINGHNLSTWLGSWLLALRVIPGPFAAVVAGHFAGISSFPKSCSLLSILVMFPALTVSAWGAWRVGRGLELSAAVYTAGLVL